MYIGNLGLDSTRTYNIDDLRYYVKNLCRLAIVSIIVRMFWVIDIVFDVKLAVKKQNESIDSTQPPDSDPDSPPNHVGSDVVQSFEMQVSKGYYTVYSIQ